VNSDEESDSDDYQDAPELSSPVEEKDPQAALRGPLSTGYSDEESDTETDSDAEEEEEKKNQRVAMKSTIPEEEEEKNEDEDVIEEGRLFIRNLPYSCTEEEISAYLKQFGEIVDVFIPLNSQRQSKGYCFATFMFPEQAITAIEVWKSGFVLRRNWITPYFKDVFYQSL
jgi:multiple RNA-binding domain-containing protein 1